MKTPRLEHFEATEIRPKACESLSPIHIDSIDVFGVQLRG
jgi:hypothetical protein